MILAVALVIAFVYYRRQEARRAQADPQVAAVS